MHRLRAFSVGREETIFFEIKSCEKVLNSKFSGRERRRILKYTFFFTMVKKNRIRFEVIVRAPAVVRRAERGWVLQWGIFSTNNNSVFFTPGKVERVFNEKRILESINFPFVIRLQYFYQDSGFIYFVMPFASGGNFYNYIQRHGPMDEDMARFYMAEIFLAVEYLHRLNLVHRDIKSDNILFDVYGHAQLADFGFCKHVKDRTYTFCGTPEYMAPEIILKQGMHCNRLFSRLCKIQILLKKIQISLRLDDCLSLSRNVLNPPLLPRLGNAECCV